VEVAVANADLRLKPGMFARLEIEFGRSENAVVVPRSAYVRYRGERGVFQVDAKGSTARFVPVHAGIINGPWVQVIDPGMSGSVVTLGHHLLSDGAKVVVSTFRIETGGATP